jgi:hypothetical protein
MHRITTVCFLGLLALLPANALAADDALGGPYGHAARNRAF